MRILWHFGYWIVREKNHKHRWSGIIGLWCNIYLVIENSCIEIHNSNRVEYYVQANRLIFTWITVWACKESENKSSINDFSSSSKHDSKDGSTWLNSKPNVRNCKEDFLFQIWLGEICGISVFSRKDRQVRVSLKTSSIYPKRSTIDVNGVRKNYHCTLRLSKNKVTARTQQM